jgi:hypothetical protein
MQFFKDSFKDFGETMRTLSLITGLVITSVTGVGYAYTLISDVKAHAVEIDSLDSRMKTLEADNPNRQVDRHRLNQVEEAVKGLKAQGDRTWDFLQDFRADINGRLPLANDRAKR